MIWSIPLEYQIESDLITKAKGAERYIPYLVDAAKRLESAGADFIVIPCNSVHIFVKEVKNAVKIPVLSIVEETVKFLKEQNIEEVGLIATETTIRKKIYQKQLEEKGIKITLPDQSEQEKIGILIKNLLQHRYGEKDKNFLSQIIDSLNVKGSNNIVLACTDLQLLKPKHESIPIYDSMETLVEVTAREINK